MPRRPPRRSLPLRRSASEASRRSQGSPKGAGGRALVYVLVFAAIFLTLDVLVSHYRGVPSLVAQVVGS